MKHIPYASQRIDKKDIQSVVKVLKSPFLTQGPVVETFERRVASYCGAKYAIAVNSGTSALHIACMAAGIQKGDEVITSPITFAASANCILYCSGKPVFADIDSDTVNIDPDEIKERLTSKTKAVIPVDFAGYPADLKAIKSIAQKHNLVIIEDASHALGAQYQNKRIGSGDYADMTIFSFHAIKQITTGEGGMVLTNNKNFYEKLLRLRTHGITRDLRILKNKKEGPWYYEMQDLGFNNRLTDIQCALGISQLKKLNQFLKRKKEIVSRYNNAFDKHEEIRFIKEQRNTQSAHHLYILRFIGNKFSADRKSIFNEFRKYGIFVNVHYIPVYHHPYYKRIGYKVRICPNAETYYQETITLPLYPGMTDSEVQRVIRMTKKVIQKYKKQSD